ncbi:MAG: GNAT family N-acetyltransferase [Candidatus Sericytochromatia bacterium]
MSPYTLTPISAEDSPGVEAVIRQVMPEFGASGPGFAIHDPEVSEMYRAYSQPGHAFFVVRQQDRVAGGGGIAPLQGAEATLCELRKMYFLPELRGLGLGQKVMDRCLQAARELGYTHCYLETLASMTQARALYVKNGFVPLAGPMGATGHFGCDAWYIRELTD